MGGRGKGKGGREKGRGVQWNDTCTFTLDKFFEPSLPEPFVGIVGWVNLKGEG